MFDTDLGFDSADTALKAADDGIAMGLMRHCEDQMGPQPTEAWMQTVVVATALAAGWATSPERQRLS